MIDHCPVCKNRVYQWRVSIGYPIYKCRGCGLGITGNQKIQSGNYHRDAVYLEEDNLFKNIFLKRAGMIPEAYGKLGSALEIGCSTGTMLSLLKIREWDVTGVEISTQAANAARLRGLKILTQPFEKINFNQKYDLVIINHTLEHMAEPGLVIKKISRILTVNGLLILSVPNFGSLSCRILRSKWPLLLPGEHLWHFTEKSLSILLSANNFTILQTEKVSGIWDLKSPLLEIWQAFVGRKKRLFKEILTALPDLLVSEIGMGSGLIMVARKEME